MGDSLWYVAYGSNTCRDRLSAYLEGTAGPAGPALMARYGAHRGCAECAPPLDDRWLTVPHRLRFRGRSRRWGGAVAFLDLAPAPDVATPARAWLLTVAQLRGLVGQEARLPDDPPPAVLDGLTATGACSTVGGGWYDTLLRLPDVDGRLAVAVTTAQDLPEGEPTEAYLATLAAGRAERDARGRLGP